MVKKGSLRVLFSICFLLACFCLSFARDANDPALYFDPDRGFYEENFDLTLSTTPAGLAILYTIDGTDPRTSATATEGISPVTILIDPENRFGRDRAPGYCVRAVAVQADTFATKVKTHTYIFANRVVELSPDGLRPGTGWPSENFGWGKNINYGMDRQVTENPLYKDSIVPALLDIPTFSMVMDLNDLFDQTTGIYMNALEHGIEWERPCSVELIYPDGTDGFQINCGVRIRGGWSRNDSNPKHAFRWFFRSEFGEPKLKYPLFGDDGVDEFDKIDLRTAMNYSWSYGAEDASKNTFLRDVFSRDMQRDMGRPYTRSRYYHLYINGTYWGLYQTQERAEASFAESYLGGESEDYDVIKVDGGYQGLFVIEATDGTLDAWRRLWDASIEGFENNDVYYRVQGLNPDGSPNPDYEVLLNVDNLIDFMITVFVSGDGDGPASGFTNGPNNFYAVYNPNKRDGFIYMRHDAEHTLGAQSWAVDRTGPFGIGNRFEKSNPQWIHEQLCENQLYRAEFANHVYKHFFNGGAVTPEVNLARLLERKAQIELAIIAESARWGDSKHEPAYTKDDGWAQAVDYIVNNFLPTRTQVVLAQLHAKGLYSQLAPPIFNSGNAMVSKGFQLKLAGPVGQIYYTTDGTDPCEPLNASTEYTELISESAAKRVLVPTSSVDQTWCQSTDFDDSAWRAGSGNIGYEQSQGYEERININVGSEMSGLRTGCYVRIPFTVDPDGLNDYNLLNLKMRYDDGFVAYLNGVAVASANALTNSLEWNSSATDNHEDEGWVTFNISEYVNQLRAGENLLAIHGLNVETSSSDFIIGTELIAGISENSGELSESARQYSGAITINNTTQVKARTMNNGNWSALNEVTLWVLEGMDNLRITEIHYHPLDEADSENDDGEYEFIELKNIGSAALDLSGLEFSRGVTYSFPANSQIGAGQFLVLSSNATAFESRYGFKPFGEYEGQLDNSGETLALNTAAGDTLIKIRYNDKYPWPRSTDGEGYSLVAKKAEPYLPQNDVRTWMRSDKIHGNPGRDDNFVSVQNTVDRTVPQNYELFQNYPNPFNAATTIRFNIPKKSFVTVKIYNVLGRQVAELAARDFEAGSHSLKWNASAFAGGIYFCRLANSDGFAVTKKLVYLK